MIGLGAGALKIYVALEPQDMRKSFQGLSELALNHLGEQLCREACSSLPTSCARGSSCSTSMGPAFGWRQSGSRPGNSAGRRRAPAGRRSSS